MLASRRAHRRGSTLTTTFRELGILPETAEALEAVGILNPFPIQEMTLPVALSGSDVIGQAKTGTGKTLGFGLPLLERVSVPADVEAGRARPEDVTNTPQALVVVPTRELCVQVTNDLLTAGKVRNVRVTAIYGGRAYEPQVEALKKGVDVVVGTPGRLLDLAGQKKLDLSHVRCLVLDEADEMLDLGFLPDVEKIIGMLPERRQTMLFSATMPGAVIGLARRYMSQPTHIRATSPEGEGVTLANIKQFVYRAHSMDKPEMIARILQSDGRGLAMIFCRTKRTAADIAEQLQTRGFASGAVHGDLGQGAREQALRAFRNGKVDVLVCTDVAARGIDVEGVTHVINYQSPEDEKTYLHRTGRTGRAGASGTAITFVDWDDIPRWQLINKALGLDYHEPVETYSTSPHFFEDLSIPAGTKGVLPRSERTRAGLGAEEIEDLGETGGRGARSARGGRGERDDRGGRGDRGGRNERGGSDTVERDRERSARTPRRRRRTRGGAPLDAEASVTASERVAAPPVDGAGSADGTAGTESGGAGRAPRRRRRTRSGAQAEAATRETVSAETVTETAAVAEAPAVSEALAPSGAVEAEAATTPRRRRTRRTADVAAAEAAESAETAEAAVDTAETIEAKPRRRTTPRKKAEAAETAVDTAEAVETEPRRRTTRKSAAKAQTAVETADAAVIPAQSSEEPESDSQPAQKPRRTRKKAAAATEPSETVEAPKARRTRKATATAASTATVLDDDGAEAGEVKPRRTRKKAVAASAEAAAEPEAGEPKPRRRTTRKAAAAPEIPAQASDEPAKPRRTRKKAAAATEPSEG
ncbi:DEAD/DEAH box helicase [Streptomyces sp. B3I8]|uniref:DEAD/DEAH box helicase n=1 Tax=Streptomyces sp. B3I8 TaxID=3042303 RepID=UPI0027854FD1|nr:DEAD/DEAH box helicase [Streptomyces sp. B3I8]MDQ0789036.1 superfamily II DNA/RNA helicase [Streptomyces sp. B3I8]